MKLENYFIREVFTSRVICCTGLDGVVGNFLIEDEVLFEDCISYLKEQGVPIIRS
jgi:hypothetical protein